MKLVDFNQILSHWDLCFAEAIGNNTIQGSLERTVNRIVVTDDTAGKWILEQIDEKKFSLKSRIAETVEGLHEQGLSNVHPYLRNNISDHITYHAGQLWMLRPFIGGIYLDRRKYLDDLWRADAMTNFLIEMRNTANQVSELNKGAVFSIADYVKDRMTVYRKHQPNLADQLESVFGALEKSFFPIHDTIRPAFCHGDFHPVNMIWGANRINSVIDWEFCGRKPEIYDIALLIGCIGFDNPDALLGPLVCRMVKTLHDSGIYENLSWNHIMGFVIAIRFGWLSEWLRWKDRSARKLEILYINLLATQKNYILNRWNLQ